MNSRYSLRIHVCYGSNFVPLSIIAVQHVHGYIEIFFSRMHVDVQFSFFLCENTYAHLFRRIIQLQIKMCTALDCKENTLKMCNFHFFQLLFRNNREFLIIQNLERFRIKPIEITKLFSFLDFHSQSIRKATMAIV